MSFTDRYTQFPGFAELSAIEGVKIIDQDVPPVSFGVGASMAVLVGEFLKGLYGVIIPIRSSQTPVVTLGGYKLVTPEDATKPDGAPIIPDNGNGFLAITNKAWRNLGVVRVDMRVTADGTATGTKVAAELDISGGPANSSITVPAGTRVSDNASLSSATRVFATDQDYVIATDGGGNGSVTGVGMVNVFGTGTVLAATPMFVNDVAWLASGTAGVIMGNDATDLSAAAIDARYQDGINATLGLGFPNSTVGVVWAARFSDAIEDALDSNAIERSKHGKGCVSVIRPAFADSSSVALGSVRPGVGARADDRVKYAYPAVMSNVPVAGGQRAMGADGFVASLLNNLAPEQNIGQPTSFLSAISGFFPQTLSGTDVQPDNYTENDYRAFKAAGIMCLVFDRDNSKWQVQSDVTPDPNRPSSKRRQMADFIQDSLRAICAPFVKTLASDENVQQVGSQIDAFLESLLSPTNPSFQRIKAYSVNSKDGNTEDLNGAGIFVWIVKVRLLASLDEIVLQTVVGEEVVVTELAAA